MKSKFELFSWARSHKAVAPICNINNLFGLETASERTMQWWFKKFCKGDKSLEDEECNGQPSEVDNNHLRTIIKPDPLTTTWEVAQELNINYSMVIWHLKQIGKVKKLNKWIVSWTEAIKKIIILKCCLLLFYATTVNHFLVGLWHATKSGFYMTTGDDQLSGWTEKHENGLDAQSCPTLSDPMGCSPRKL